MLSISHRKISLSGFSLAVWGLLIFSYGSADATPIPTSAITSATVAVQDDDAPAPTPKDDKSKSKPGADADAKHKDDAEDPAEGKLPDFAKVTKGFTKTEGMFDLYRKEQKLYAEIKPNQFNKPFLAPIAIARGAAMAGNPLNFGDEWVLTFKLVDKKVQVIRKNIHFQAEKDTPRAKAVEQNYLDSVLLALPIVTKNPQTQGVLIDLGEIFFSDFAQIGMGPLDPNRTTWYQIKAFPNNLEIQVEATFAYPGRGAGMGQGSVVDARGITIVIHYSLIALPDVNPYKPRIADYRVGHFLNSIRKFDAKKPDDEFRRMINRWPLEKANPDAKLSAPKKQIVWWVENTVPFEYRPFVEEGILEWNKAFEKIGFRNAIAVRWQEDKETFDPEDINYCTFRWITTDSPFAMSGLRSNPLTGEMIDGDVIFDDSWIKAWKEEYALLTGLPVPSGRRQGAPGGNNPLIAPTNPMSSAGEEIPLGLGRVISPILAARQGYGLPTPLPFGFGAKPPVMNRAGTLQLHAAPQGWDPIQAQLRNRTQSQRYAACGYSVAKRREMNIALLAIGERMNSEAASLGKDDATDADKDKKDKDKDKDKEDKEKKADKGPKLPEEFLGQLIKEVVMHEVGHSLGLRHNFKASALLPNDKLHDKTVTRAQGMVGSVMDYNPVNIALPGKPQGDYCTNTIGPYDYWAIEFAYKPIDGDEEEALAKIAQRSPDPNLLFASDEDMYGSNDPLVNVYDLGNDVLVYARDRVALANQLLPNLETKITADGESWDRVENAFQTLLSEYGNAAALATGYIAGQSVNRDHRGKNGRDPITPISGEKQREALNFAVKTVLSDKSFQFSPALLRKFTTRQWMDSGGLSMIRFSGGSLYDEILGIQGILLDHCLSGNVLSRLQNQELQSDPQAKPLTIAEVFRTLTDGVWTELNPEAPPTTISVIRRNLQREHLRKLAEMVLGSENSNSLFGGNMIFLFMGGGAAPDDAKNLARMHLNEIQGKIEKILNNPMTKLDDATKAHLEETRFRITKILDARLNLNQP